MPIACSIIVTTDRNLADDFRACFDLKCVARTQTDRQAIGAGARALGRVVGTGSTTNPGNDLATVDHPSVAVDRCAAISAIGGVGGK